MVISSEAVSVGSVHVQGVRRSVLQGHVLGHVGLRGQRDFDVGWKTFSNACGANAEVLGANRSAIAEACRASTETILPARVSVVGSVMYCAAPLYAATPRNLEALRGGEHRCPVGESDVRIGGVDGKAGVAPQHGLEEVAMNGLMPWMSPNTACSAVLNVVPVPPATTFV